MYVGRYLWYNLLARPLADKPWICISIVLTQFDDFLAFVITDQSVNLPCKYTELEKSKEKSYSYRTFS